MRLDPPPRRTPVEPLLPMINVVFLLLIFFLIVARMTPPAPLDVQVPLAAGQPMAGDVVLYLGADGTVAAGDARGDAALAALAQICAAPCATPLMLHADATASAEDLAGLMAQLGAAGWADIQLVTAVP